VHASLHVSVLAWLFVCASERCVQILMLCFVSESWSLQVRASDPSIFYSCDDNFILAEKTVHRGGCSEDQSLGINNLGNIPLQVTSNLEGICSCFHNADQFSFIHFRSNKLVASWQRRSI
jgi:hypothetical protein